MQKALETDGKKGMRILVMYSTNTFKPTRKLTVLFSGEFAKKGIIINFCPFCGENLDKIHKLEKHRIKMTGKKTAEVQ